MKLIENLKNVSVLGAAGKMGSGILTLLAMEMGKIKIQNPNTPMVLNAIDISDEALTKLMTYVEGQLLKNGEKRIVEIREWYKDDSALVSNEDVVSKYVADIMGMIKPSIRIESTYDSTCVFEAIKEDKSLKARLFNQIYKNNPNVNILTNTSSIPIGEIDEASQLDGHIIGFHFYNPPVIQKLIEIIPAKETPKELNDFAHELATAMRKTIVYSKDKAGFIGNGHFMRDALYAIREAKTISENMSWAEAIYIMDTISRDLLIRPMGIFQLIDYVGVDVVSFILESMQPSFPQEKLQDEVLVKLLENGISGGQFSNGSQKDGILKYEKGKVVAVYDLDKAEYVLVEEIKQACKEFMGKLPETELNWKMAVKSHAKAEVLGSFFEELHAIDSQASRLAVKYGSQSKAIAYGLINTDVAKNEADVNTVLETGFFHAYGPINTFFE